MDVGQMQRSYLEYTASLFREGILDSQFGQLLQLQDESNPDFLVEVVTLFFEDSERIINDLTRALEQEFVDFKKIGAHVHQLKGSSSSIGAQRVKRCLRCLFQVLEMLNASEARISVSEEQASDFVHVGAADQRSRWSNSSDRNMMLTR